MVNDTNGFGLLSFRAISPILNVVEIDGADDNQAFFSEERGRTRAGYSTSQAAVREFQVNTGVYSAEFGRAVGGVVNSVTKSGGNNLHGEVYFYNRNSSRSAYQPGATNTVFNPTTNSYVTSPYRPKDNRNQYGFAVGGPIKKDKLFWFYSFDAYRRNFPGTAKANNPNAFFVGAECGTERNGDLQHDDWRVRGNTDDDSDRTDGGLAGFCGCSGLPAGGAVWRELRPTLRRQRVQHAAAGVSCRTWAGCRDSATS